MNEVVPTDLHSPLRELIECQMAHADLDTLIDQAEAGSEAMRDELSLRRLKKQRLRLRDRMDWLQRWLSSQEPS